MHARYLRQSVVETAKHLGRSVASVKHKAQRLGLNSYYGEYLSAKTIAGIFNCDISVVKRWCEKLELPCIKVKTPTQTRYLIDPVKFWKWAEDNREEINWRKYEQGTILPEPSWICNISDTYSYPERHRKEITGEEKRVIKSLMRQNKTNAEIAKEIRRTYYATSHITKNIYKKKNVS